MNAARRSSCSPAASRCCTGSFPRSSTGALAKGKYVTVCTNALLMEKKLDQYQPHRRFNWSVHLDGDKEMHDKSVCQAGVYDRAVAAIRRAKVKGFRVNINCTLFSDAEPERVAELLRSASWSSASTASPYRRATPMSAHRTSSTSSIAPRPSNCSGTSSAATRGRRKWPLFQSGLFLDFLAGNQTYHCTPWGNPTRTVFGWQRPCYLLGEGYAKTFKELMEETDWDDYGTGNYEKCADCMVHSGFEASAVMDAVEKPWKVAQGRARGNQDRWADGAGHPARPASGPQNMSSRGTSSRS